MSKRNKRNKQPTEDQKDRIMMAAVFAVGLALFFYGMDYIPGGKYDPITSSDTPGWFYLIVIGLIGYGVYLYFQARD